MKPISAARQRELLGPSRKPSTTPPSTDPSAGTPKAPGRPRGARAIGIGEGESRPASSIVVGVDPGAVNGIAVLDMAGPTPRILSLGSCRDPRAVLEMAAWRPVLVAVESVSAVFSRARFGAGMASALVNTARIEGQVLEHYRGLGIQVATCSAAEWRRALTGSGTARDARIKVVLGMRGLLPGRTNAHERDAIGVALFAWQRARVGAMGRARTVERR